MALLRDEVVQRFGVLPNFFRSGPEMQDVAGKLWQFARFGYLDNPLPSLFKERLFVRLSRFCEVRYCIARHAGFLLGAGHPAGDPACPTQTIDDVLRLLQAPLPCGRGLALHVERCQAVACPTAELPPPDSPLEQSMFACATHVFLQTADAGQCLAALECALGAVRLQQLLILLSFVRTAHFWTKVHGELALDDDVQELLAGNDRLRACLLEEPEPESSDTRRLALQQELADSRLLHEISIEMIAEPNLQALYGRIIDAAARLMHSPFASMQMLDPQSDGKALLLQAHRGFSPHAAQFWQRVRIDSATSCGLALRDMLRVVIADVEQCPHLAATEDLATCRETGIRSMQTTPLRTRSGELVGMISTHWREPHRPSERELRLLDILARQAADLIASRRSDRALRERERKYRALFDSIDEGFCILERIESPPGQPADYRYLEANPAFLKHSGISNPVGMTVREAFPHQPDSWVGVFAEVLRTGKPARFEPTLTTDGRVFELHAFRIDDGTLRRLGVTVKEITRRRRRELENALFSAVGEDFSRSSGVDDIMQAVGTRIGAFLRVSVCLFIDIDAAQTAATVSHGWHAPGVQNLLGTYRIADFIGGSLLHELRAGDVVVVRDTRSHADTDSARFAQLGLRAGVAMPFLRDGRWRSVLLLGDTHARAWRPDEIELCRELANRVFPRLERARAEAALRESEERLRSADRVKDEFLAALAHELRNPLAPIRSALHLLRLQGRGADPAPLYDMLERQVGHVVRLVDDLLELSRVSRGAIDLKRETVPLSQVLRVAAETSRPLIEQGKHHLTLHLPQDNLIVNADIVRLAQVFANLLNNAAKYTDEGGRIVLSARRDGDCAIVEVRDNGIGIAPEHLPRLFDMFAQVDRSTSRVQGGLGIGLWLVKRLVEMHGGSVAAESAGLGRGSCFKVSLPLVQPLAMPPGAKPRAGTADLHKRRMLVVDDNHDAADSLGMVLGLLGADVRVVHNGPAALAMLETWKPSVVLLDLGMPGMNGFDVARHIRDDPHHDDVLLVAVTGWGQEDDRQRTRDAGFDHHLTKPIGLDVLQSLFAEGELEELGVRTQ